MHILDGNVTSTGVVPCALLARTSGVVELDTGFLVADPISAAETYINIESRLAIDEHVVCAGWSEYPS